MTASDRSASAVLNPFAGGGRPHMTYARGLPTWLQSEDVLSPRMDREMLQKHLAQAEEHVALGEHHVSRQREVVAELERAGHDTAEARRLLAHFEQMQKMHLADRDRIRHEMAQNSS